MTFHVAGRKILQDGSRIAVIGEHGVETIQFILPRRYGEIDLAKGEAMVLYENERGQTGAAFLSPMPSRDRVVLVWTVGGEAASVPGRLEAKITVTGRDGGWQFSTEPTVFYVDQGLTGQGGMVVTPEVYMALTGLVERRGSLINDLYFSRGDHALKVTRYDGSRASVPLPRPDIVAHIIDGC